MFLAVAVHTPGVYVSPQNQGLFIPSKHFIRARKIAPHDKYVFFEY